MTEPSTPQPLLLSYDRHNPKKNRGGTRIILFFWLGMFAAYLLYAVVLSIYLASTDPSERTFSPLSEGVLVPFIGFILSLIPATLFLGIAMWVRLKMIHEIRHARSRVAFICGLLFNLFSPISCLNHIPLKMQAPLMWTYLGWIIIVPILASFLLSYRSHLRD